MIETFKKYSAFGGTATRSEYWGVILVTWAISVAASLVFLLFVGMGSVGSVVGLLGFLAVIVFNVWLNLATMIRRCRDAGINPWFVLTLLIPYIGFVSMIVFGCLPSKSLES